MLKTVRRHLQRCSLIALVAIFGLVAAPSVSRMLSQMNGAAGFDDICSSSVSSDHGAQGTAGVSDHLTHCPLCVLAAAPALPLASLDTVSAPMPLSQALPERFFRASRPLYAWASVRSRAPPFLS